MAGQAIAAFGFRGSRRVAWRRRCETCAKGGPADERFQQLYESEINFSISGFFDDGFTVKLGDPINGFRAEGKAMTIAEAEVWLTQAALRRYPGSAFAKAMLATIAACSGEREA